ncbi:hypothetical protein [Microvirga sp. TS319]|uniref:hypothetical protein n=1 Tax=Microvirga sp. TS319 TaxID=3241165 RepID=UPI00351A586C
MIKLSDDVLIVGARIYGNLRQGIRVEGSSDTLIRDSFVFDNSQEADRTYDEIQIRSRLDDVITHSTYYSINTHILNNTIYSDGAFNARFGIREEINNRNGGSTGLRSAATKSPGWTRETSPFRASFEREPPATI